MSQSFERAKSRLENIETIEPLLSALRTMSMGAWQMANKKIDNLSDYENYLNQILYTILPYVGQKPSKTHDLPITNPSPINTIILAIGSERGLCGKFNAALAEKTLAYIHQNEIKAYQLWVMGSRLLQEFERRGITVSWRKALPASGLTSYQETYTLTQIWLEQFESYAFNKLIIIFNQAAKGSYHLISTINLLPFKIEPNAAETLIPSRRWPPPIIETDPKGIYRQIIQHFITTSFYQALLKSAAAEHSARYHLMQEASDNAEEIIEDLIYIINAERKRKITQQMQELAVSAGLLEH